MGYTVVEVLIFLAISGVLFVSAMLAMSGKQAQTEFNQTVRDFQTQLQSINDNVAHGFYNRLQAFSCQYAGGAGSGISITAGNTAPGTNTDCIYIGEAIQFAPNGNANTYRLYTLAGQRQTANGGNLQDVGSLDDAKPTAIAQGLSTNTTTPDMYQDYKLANGIQVGKVTYQLSSGGPQNTGALAVVTSFPATDATTGSLNSGSQSFSILPIIGTNMGDSGGDFVDKVNQITSANGWGTMPINPPNGVTICLTGGGTNQSALIIIGGQGHGHLDAALQIITGGCP